jgi:hypothetical protein
MKTKFTTRFTEVAETNSAMEFQNTPNKLSRRNWLRDAAIAATSAVIVPSMLISCSDHKVPPGVGGPVDPTPAEIELYGAAAQNLIRLRKWYDNVYESNSSYNIIVYAYFKSGKPPKKTWIDIIEDIAINIGIKILEAAVAEIPGASAAVAIAADQIMKWANEPGAGGKVDATLADFADVYKTQYDAVTSSLLSLASKNGDGHYKNLQDAFAKGPIDFNGKKYTLNDLAQQRFPDGEDVNDTEKFGKLRDTAVLQYKKNIWNTMFILAGEMKVYDSSTFWEHFKTRQNLPRTYAIESHYPNHKATYLRGYYYKDIFGEYFYYASFYFTFDGDELSDSAAAALFKDDAPGNIINPNGLFERDYVFKQFHAKKPDFGKYFEIRRDTDIGPCKGDTDCSWFDPDANNYQFTKGAFGN